jgi:hypothetical protein
MRVCLMGLNRTVAAVFGVVYLIAGLTGFILASPLFGLFEVNALHNVVHVAIGALLLWAMMNASTAVMGQPGHRHRAAWRSGVLASSCRTRWA